MVTDGTFCHASDPPVTPVGADGAVRSSQTAPPSGGDPGQGDVLPTASVA